MEALLKEATLEATSSFGGISVSLWGSRVFLDLLATGHVIFAAGKPLPTSNVALSLSWAFLSWPGPSRIPGIREAGARAHVGPHCWLTPTGLRAAVRLRGCVQRSAEPGLTHRTAGCRGSDLRTVWARRCGSRDRSARSRRTPGCTGAGRSSPRTAPPPPGWSACGRPPRSLVRRGRPEGFATSPWASLGLIRLGGHPLFDGIGV